MVTLNDYLYSGSTIFRILNNYIRDLRKDAKVNHNEIDLVHSNFLIHIQEMLEHNDFLTAQSQKIREFYRYMAKEYPFLAFTFRGRIKSLIRAEEKFNGYIVEYIYDYYDNFRLLLKCGDSGKFELFIHNMVDREMKSSLKYMEKMKEAGVEIPVVEESLMHMIYSGFFSSVFQIIEHDIDRETAKKNVHQLKEFNTGGWERLWNIEFPV